VHGDLGLRLGDRHLRLRLLDADLGRRVPLALPFLRLSLLTPLRLPLGLSLRLLVEIRRRLSLFLIRLGRLAGAGLTRLCRSLLLHEFAQAMQLPTTRMHPSSSPVAASVRPP